MAGAAPCAALLRQQMTEFSPLSIQHSSLSTSGRYRMVSSSQRFSRERPCPICGGYDGMARGKGVRCTGFLSEDGRDAYCTREEHAPAPLNYNDRAQAWVHRLTDTPQPSVLPTTYDYCDPGGVLRYQVLR